MADKISANFNTVHSVVLEEIAEKVHVIKGGVKDVVESWSYVT